MLSDSFKALILEELARQGPGFIGDVDVDLYLAKLGARAEILSDSAEGRCPGCVAFYCNDHATKQAFITQVIVDSRDRRLGIGRALVGCVLDMAKRRGFTSCRLEVAKRNDGAHAMYLSLGFHVVEDRADKYLLEIGLGGP